MSIRHDIKTLERLIARIGEKIDAAPDHKADWEAHREAGRAIIDHLVQYEGAKLREHVCDGYALQLVGIRTTCTSGHFGLLRNWQVATKRKIAQIEREVQS